ncbi:MAG TPA: 6,7-dimethyl-8-ribityllumazine synthase [Caulobacteraceae bacterium]|nr:6,7-dimethyl-8-ribityllumazine synthase [Caulobacteraceae bacterium]
MPQDPIRILIVEARADPVLADTLLASAKNALAKAGAEFDVVTVPGALEIPAVVAMAEEGGHRPAGVRYDGFVALGCVIRGESLHYGIAMGEVARALNDLAIGRRLAIGNGVLAVENTREAQAFASAGAGGAAARATLAVVDLKRKLLGHAR